MFSLECILRWPSRSLDSLEGYTVTKQDQNISNFCLFSFACLKARSKEPLFALSVRVWPLRPCLYLLRQFCMSNEGQISETGRNPQVMRTPGIAPSARSVKYVPVFQEAAPSSYCLREPTDCAEDEKKKPGQARKSALCLFLSNHLSWLRFSPLEGPVPGAEGAALAPPPAPGVCLSPGHATATEAHAAGKLT